MIHTIFPQIASQERKFAALLQRLPPCGDAAGPSAADSPAAGVISEKLLAELEVKTDHALKLDSDEWKADMQQRLLRLVEVHGPGDRKGCC